MISWAQHLSRCILRPAARRTRGTYPIHCILSCTRIRIIPNISQTCTPCLRPDVLPHTVTVANSKLPFPFKARGIDFIIIYRTVDD